MVTIQEMAANELEWPRLHRFSPYFEEDGSVVIQINAPACDSVSIQCVAGETDEPTGPLISMHSLGAGRFVLPMSAADGAKYYVRLPSGVMRPDPASLFQPRGVHGPSQLVDHRRYRWQDQKWRGVARRDLIIYELHVGTFTEAGTFAAAAERLSELARLGITAIELMPIVETGGTRNWGYDGVNLFAPRNSYGTPDDLKLFIDIAHGSGLAVFLDVVYNHFGPEGNYLHEFGGYVSPRHQTVWGDAPNFDGDHARLARDFVLANVNQWIEDYHFDGLRLDAIHCMRDDSKVHIVTEIGQLFAQMRNRLDRTIHLIAESNIYDPDLLGEFACQGHGFDMIWCDDFVHSVYATLIPGDHKSDRVYHPREDLKAVLDRGYVFRGTLRTTRERVPADETTPAANFDSLVFAIQHHDFVGNHPEGPRLHQLVSVDAQRAAATLLLLYPTIPMLFMGEEFASDNPFLFFANFEDESIRAAVVEGRRREYPQYDWSGSESPLSPVTFARSRIGSPEEGDLRTLRWYHDLIRIRRQWTDAGILGGEFPEIEWNASCDTVQIAYATKMENARFVIVRLHPADDSPQSYPLCCSGEILMMQNGQAVGGERYELGPFGVAVGVGQPKIGR